ncbi:MAG: galactokinase family protein, partial [Bacteroidota bacterium]
MQEVLSARFVERFQQSPLLVFAPGRINLIGEHTDYNLGYVMPAAIHLGIQFAMGPTEDGSVFMEALDLGETYEGHLQELQPAEQGWANYLLGICAQLKQAGKALSGFRVMLGGNIPVGSGLSSSAALECGFLFGLNELFGLGLGRMEMAKIAQAAEHSKYVGVQCGIMDQFASLFGQSGQVVQLDCRSMEYA